MQIATSHPALPIFTARTAEAVAPTTLFRLANARSFAALHLLAAPEGRVPSAATAELAIQEAQAGERILRSAIVPSTPFRQREAASTAVTHLQLAATLLTDYVAAVRDLGTGGTVPAARVPDEARTTLSQARDRILAAVSQLALNEQ